MRFGRLGTLKHGYNPMTIWDSDMLMDIGYQVMADKESLRVCDPMQETAFVILAGEVEVAWYDKRAVMQRSSLFDEKPYCLHVPRDTDVVLAAKRPSEILIQKTINDCDFAPVFYRPDDVQTEIFGQGKWHGTAERIVRTIFDYANAPYSNMVNGEVVNAPGCWSGYIPHTHPQPEVYAYRFDKPQGFGACFIGDMAFKIEDNSWAELPGGYMHPQVAAPGYAMWYSWMIRHLSGNPWRKSRNYVEEHEWLLTEAVEIWQPDRKK